MGDLTLENRISDFASPTPLPKSYFHKGIFFWVGYPLWTAPNFGQELHRTATYVGGIFPSIRELAMGYLVSKAWLKIPPLKQS